MWPKGGRIKNIIQMRIQVPGNRMAEQQLGKTGAIISHPAQSATAYHTLQNRGKAMSKGDKEPSSRHQASSLTLNTVFKINSGII